VCGVQPCGSNRVSRRRIRGHVPAYQPKRNASSRGRARSADAGATDWVGLRVPGLATGRRTEKQMSPPSVSLGSPEGTRVTPTAVLLRIKGPAGTRRGRVMLLGKGGGHAFRIDPDV
jgi:hypothetical protein